MRIVFTDREYHFEHGKAPRGYGHWCFTFEGHELWEVGTLTEAKKKVKAHIKEIAPKGYAETVYVNVEP